MFELINIDDVIKAIQIDLSIRYVLYQCNSYRVGRCFLNFKDAFDIGLKKFGKDNFYIELQADYGGFMVDRLNIKTISKVTDFDKMKELATDINFNQNLDIYKTNEYYNEFIKAELIMEEWYEFYTDYGLVQQN